MKGFSHDDRSTLLLHLTYDEGLKLHRVDYVDYDKNLGWFVVEEEDKTIDYLENDLELYYIAVEQHDILGKIINDLESKVHDIEDEIKERNE